MIKLHHLHSLTALRDSGNLARAAERLHLTQSALSHQLKELEERLEVTLFERKSRPPRFTAAGERLLTLADEVLPLIRQAKRDLGHIRGGQGGRLHLAVECHSCFDWLMPVLEDYRHQWPRVTLDISMAHSFEPLAALAQNEVDLVVTADPDDNAAITYRPLFRYQNLLLLPPRHRLAARNWIAPQDLADETLITYPVDTTRLDLFRRFLDPAGVAVERRSSELTVMILQLVASGRGLAALPQWAASQAVVAGQVLARPLGEHGLWSTLYAAVRREEQELAYLEAFIDGARTDCFERLEGVLPTE
ncbi:MAG: LysR family transcriptional regulator [Gammaproteobacteria bacterium HGW-Gammaproteobacteria-1]|jgi:LysR family transcriptional regulator for metE and metH|nr:MAG: LysR family transcriptional regulator [Gammaproteobacteria bacterium HGW-Gammaproteobacteria-1]